VGKAWLAGQMQPLFDQRCNFLTNLIFHVKSKHCLNENVAQRTEKFFKMAHGQKKQPTPGVNPKFFNSIVNISSLHYSKYFVRPTAHVTFSNPSC